MAQQQMNRDEEKRVREARREQGTHRLRAIFMILMVMTLGFILFKMVT